MPRIMLIITILLYLSPQAVSKGASSGSYEYEWWLSYWADQTLACRIFIHHEDTPTAIEVYGHCGEELYQAWLNTPACATANEGGDTSTCEGLYLSFVSSREVAGEGQIGADTIPYAAGVGKYVLPKPEAWLDIEGCTFVFPGYQCSEIPDLVITAEEPLPSERIIQIEGLLNNAAFRCEGERCAVELPATAPEGSSLGFWATSSSGESSPLYNARLRVMQQEENGPWLVNVLSDRWQGYSQQSCEQAWDIFPPLEPLPSWLKSPQNAVELASNQPYTYLAGRLIGSHVVNASGCAHFGIAGSGYANPCGMEIARIVVNRWQNRFDPQIIAASGETGIPAQLLKNLFAQESQFWPGSYYLSPEERGLGQLTPDGADVLLMWNAEVFAEMCPRVLHKDNCQSGYMGISDLERTMVQGALMNAVNADCDQCPMGLDIKVAENSIQIFAQAVHANCQQAGQLIANARDQAPGLVSSYEDLWRFTLVNYHAGAGCLNAGIQSVPFDQPLTWESLRDGLDMACPGTGEYVDKVTGAVAEVEE